MNYKKLILPGILLAVTVGVYFYEPKSKKTPKPPKQNSQSAFKQKTAGLQFSLKDLKKQAAQIEQEFTFLNQAKLIRDPFSKVKPKPKPKPKTKPKKVKKKPKPKPKPEVKLSLQGIWLSDGKKVAFINSTTVGLQEMIEGYQLIEINDKDVVLKKAGKKRFLKLESAK